MKLKYIHVDVFSAKPLSGNGLIVFYDCPANLDSQKMLQLTQEMRQFESIFLQETAEESYSARIFTMEEELDFAGHPILGAAAVLHYLHKKNLSSARWKISIKQRDIIVDILVNENSYCATMHQGKPQFIHMVTTLEREAILHALNLKPDDLYPDLPLEVISTGLPHLIVPLTRRGIEKTKIVNDKMNVLLQSIGAKFVYVFDVPNREGRTWDNAGICEDIATGSAAGAAGAYLHRHKLINENEVIINQGRFVGRPSELNVIIENDDQHVETVKVCGDVSFFALGETFSF